MRDKVQGGSPNTLDVKTRDLNMMAMIYYTGLCATELVMLKREQYQGSHLNNVPREGQNRARNMYVPIEVRRYRDDYLRFKRVIDDRC